MDRLGLASPPKGHCRVFFSTKFLIELFISGKGGGQVTTKAHGFIPYFFALSRQIKFLPLAGDSSISSCTLRSRRNAAPGKLDLSKDFVGVVVKLSIRTGDRIQETYQSKENHASARTSPIVEVKRVETLCSALCW